MNKEYYKILEDETITKKFLDLLLDEDPINDFEMYGITLAARNKYFNKPEDPNINYPNLNGTTMFTRIFADSKHKDSLIKEIISKVNRLECAKGGYKVNMKYPDPVTGLFEKVDIPEESMICYFYINPLNTSAGYKNFLDKLALFQQQAIDRVVSLEQKKDSNFNIKKDIKRLHHIAEVAYTQSMSKKRWYDIDIDYSDELKQLDEIKVLIVLITYLRERIDVLYGIDILKDRRFYIIKTYSGFHLGFKTSILGELKCGAEEILKDIKELFKLYKVNTDEIKLNKEFQIPLPGTLQGGKLVEFIDLDWIEKNTPKPIDYVQEELITIC